ncbi:MAG: sulfite exporter TauE/SafE family protein [Betaproteobacteria bacterium]
MPLPPLLADLPWYALVAIPLIVLVAYANFGATGFGSSAVAVPALVHVFPLAFSVALATSLDVFAATSTSFRFRRVIAWDEFRRLVPAALIGIALGVTLVVNLPRAPALLALGVFITLYGAYLLAGPRALRRAPGWLAWPIGLAGGVFSALFGTGGPVYMVFLSARIQDKASLRATSAAVVTMSVWVRLVVFAVAGVLLQPALLIVAAVMLPLMFVGLKLGNRLHRRLSGPGVLRLIAVVLILNGASLIVRAGAG